MIQRFFKPVAMLAGWLVAGAASGSDAVPGNDAALTKYQLLESNVAYLRVARVTTALPDAMSSAINASPGRTPLAGTVLDLRYAEGDDSNAVAAVARWFSSRKEPLAILVNSETRGAATTLAAALRADRDGLIFGSPNSAIRPDIAVTVRTNDEKVFFENPYTPTNGVASLDTNNSLPFVDHTSEADLVRARVKDGDPLFPRLSVDEGSARFPSPSPMMPPKPMLRDPVLARALDFIKGLAALGQYRS